MSGFGGYLGFEPNKLSQLSRSLENLAQNLEGNLAKITSIISAQGGHVRGETAVSRWSGQARDDANDMSRRNAIKLVCP